MKKENSKHTILNTKNSKGITLIALIITIIVLLIIAVVAIGAVHESDIIAHAENAATGYNTAKGEENDAILSYETFIEENIPGPGKGNGPETFVATKYSAIGTSVSEYMWIEFNSNDNTLEISNGDSTANGTYTYNQEEGILSISYTEGDEIVEEQFNCTKIGDSNVIYYSYYNSKDEETYLVAYATESIIDSLETIENVQYTYQTTEGVTWYINFDGNEIYWSTEDIEQDGSLGNAVLNGSHYRYFSWLDGYIYKYDPEDFKMTCLAKIYDNGQKLEQYMVSDRASDYSGVWQKVTD